MSKTNNANVNKTNWQALDRLDGQLDGQLDGVQLPALKAVLAVESRGNGFLSNGKPKILFEGHQFWKRLAKAGINPRDYVAGNEDILYPKYNRKKYVGGAREYGRLARAMQINEEVALQCASYGIAQIMGFNYKVCGYGSVHEFVDAMDEHDSQIEAFIGFLKSGLWKHLKGDNPNWKAFARAYNGPLYYRNNYSGKLARAYRRYVQDPQEEFKPLRKSRTIQGGSIAGIGSIAGAATVFKQIQDGITQVKNLSTDSAEAITTVTQTVTQVQDQLHNAMGFAGLFGLVVIAGVGWLVYARLNDRQEGYK